MPEAVTGTMTQVPAPNQFSVLYARVCNYVMAPSDTEVTAIAKEGINEGILRLNTRNWSWMRTNEDITLVSGQQEYPMLGFFKAPRACQLLDSGGNVVGTIDYYDPKDFDFWFPNRVTSDSLRGYTIYNEFVNSRLTLNSSPGAGVTSQYSKLRLRYYRRMNVLSADADVFFGPTEAEPYIVWYGRATVAAHWAPEKVPFAVRRYEELWADLVRSDVKRELTDF